MHILFMVSLECKTWVSNRGLLGYIVLCICYKNWTNGAVRYTTCYFSTCSLRTSSQ